MYTAGLRALLGICLAGLLAACQPSATASPRPTVVLSPTAPASCTTGSHVERITSSGKLRFYRLYVPLNYRPAASAALVFGFHGAGGTAAQYEDSSGLSAVADRQGFIAVYPQAEGSPATWNAAASDQNEDLQLVRDLIDVLVPRCHIDPARMYATGFSRGGGMANRLACNLSDRIAAIGSVSGAYESPEYCSPTRPVPVIAFHGTADAEVPYNGIGDLSTPRMAYYSISMPIPQWASAWAARNGCSDKSSVAYQKDNVAGQNWGNCRGGADVMLYTIKGGGHTWPDITDGFNAAQLMWDFFVKHPMPPGE